MEDDTNLTDVLIERYSVTQEVELEDEGGVKVIQVTLAEARKALETLQLYELQCPKGRKDIILKLESIKGTLNQRYQTGRNRQGYYPIFRA